MATARRGGDHLAYLLDADIVLVSTHADLAELSLENPDGNTGEET
jgi:hypothetical protein